MLFLTEITSLFLVRETGLEPVRHRHTHLKRACLPVPALAQKGLLQDSTCLLYHPAGRLSISNLVFFTPVSQAGNQPSVERYRRYKAGRSLYRGQCLRLVSPVCQLLLQAWH